MTATVMIPTVLREIHRLRRHHRDLQTEIERLPRLLKAHQGKVAKQEQTLKQAQDDLKHLKVQAHDKEVNLKTTMQLLAKYEKQTNDMKSPKEVEAKEKEIATSKKTIEELEEQILLGLAEIDESTARIPQLDKAVKDAKAELAVFEKDSKERRQHLMAQVKLAEDELKKYETRLPATVRALYDRLIKSHGADALALVQKSSCGHCHTSVTAQNVNELYQGHFVCCNSCGRMLYAGAEPSPVEAGT